MNLTIAFIMSLVALISVCSIPVYAQEGDWQQYKLSAKESTEKGNLSEAETYLVKAVYAAEQLGREDSRLCSVLDDLAGVYVAEKKYDLAEPLYKRILAIYEKALGPNHPDVAGSLLGLGELYLAEGRSNESVPLFQRAQSIYSRDASVYSTAVARTDNDLGMAYFNQQNYSQSEPLLKQALDLRESILAPNDPDIAASLQNYSALLDKTNRQTEAQPLVTRAKSILSMP